MKKKFKLFDLNLLVLGQVGTVNVLAQEDKLIDKNVLIPISISTYRDRVVPQKGTPKRIYVEQSDNYGNLYGGYLEHSKVLKSYSIGYLLVRYSGDLILIGNANPR